MQNTQSYCYIYPKASRPYIFCSPDYTVNKWEKKDFSYQFMYTPTSFPGFLLFPTSCTRKGKTLEEEVVLTQYSHVKKFGSF